MSPEKQSGRLPDFVCIGAKKAATSWLHVNLRQHPNVWMPPVKELHHFDRVQRRPLIAYYRTRKQVRGQLREAIRQLPASAAWLFRYFFLFRSDRWYASLFTPSDEQICGESAPTYATLSSQRIDHVHSLLPNAKIVYILRDPIERVWSHAKMHAEGIYHTNVDRLSDQELRENILREWRIIGSDSDYLGNLERWQKHYADEQLRVFFFNHLQSNPVEFFRSILRFLELTTADHVIPSNLDAQRNMRSARPIPAPLRRWLTELLLPQIESLHAHFDNEHTATWLKDAYATLKE